VLLLFWGTFENLVTYVVFMDFIFMTLAAISLFIFRKRMGKPGKDGYKVSLYPVVPLLFVGITTWFLASTLIGRPEQAIAGMVLVVLGLPFYWIFKRGQQRKTAEGSAML
jgi:APA family basic amino acid/polyamine antiporter